MIDLGILPALVTMLKEKSDSELTLRLLSGIDDILTMTQGGEDEENTMLTEFDSMGGQDLLEDLLKSMDRKVVQSANDIIEKYYAVEDTDEFYKGALKLEAAGKDVMRPTPNPSPNKP